MRLSHGKPHKAPWPHQTAQKTRVRPGLLSAVPSGLNVFRHAALDRSAYAAFSRKAAQGSLAPPNCTENPGPSWATLSRPFGTERVPTRCPGQVCVCGFLTESRTRLLGPTKLHRKPGSVLGYSQPSLRD